LTDDYHVTDDLPAYALHALESKESHRIADHLSKCAACQKEWQFFQALADSLGLGSPLREPPDGLKQNLLQQVQPSGMHISSQKANWLSLLRNALRGATPVWGAVSLVIILVLAISNALLWRQVNTLTQAQPPSFLTIALKGTQKAPGAKGMVVVTADGNSGTLIVDGLSPLSSDQQYQLWLIKDGKRTNGGVFSVDQDGYSLLEVHSSIPLNDFSGFGVTIEPAGGSPAPTGDKVLGGET
jgi:anti-sigma-K factor RskA